MLTAAHATAQVPTPWIAADIGYPALTGLTTYDSGAFTVTAGGTGIAGRADQFHYIYQPITGDATIVARVSTLTAADPESKIGLMFRNSLDRASRHAFVYVNGSGGSGFYRRPFGGGKTAGTPGPAAITPTWVAIRRAGGVFTTYVSNDGVAWQTINTDTVSMSGTVYVGIAASARSTSQRLMATLSTVTIQTAGGPPTSGSGSTNGGGGTSTGVLLSSGDRALDIGAPRLTGTTTVSGGNYTIQAGGLSIGGISDEFHFVYRPVTGDADVRVQVDHLAGVDNSTKVGVMVRNTLSKTAEYAASLVTAGNVVFTSGRLSAGGAATDTTGASGRPPMCLRLVRSGQHFTAFRSDDCRTWQQTDAFDIAMNATVYAGIALSSHSASYTATAQASNLSIATSTTNAAPTVAITTPVSGQSFTTPASVNVSATAADAEGRLSRVDFFANGGLVSSDASAPYSIAWTPTTAGTYSLTAKAYDADGGQATSSSVTVTVSTPAVNQPPTVTLTSPATGQSFTAPANVSVTANAADPEGRLSRVDFLANGGLVASDASAPYTITWTPKVAGNYSLTAIAYDIDGAQTSSSPVSVSVTTTAVNQPPSVALTSPTAGQSFTAPANVNLLATASDPEGRLSRVDFFANGGLVSSDASAPYSGTWTPNTAGTYALTAVAYDADGGQATSASVTVAVTVTTGNQAPVVALTSPLAGQSFTAPANVSMSATAVDPEGRMSRVEFYANGGMLGSDASAPYTAIWTPNTAGTYTLTAIAYDADGGRTTSSAVSVTVGGSTTNQPPTVTLTAPAMNQSFAAPASVTLTASASDPENRLARVEFYANGALVASDATAPFSTAWSPGAGVYQLTAAAFDTEGNRGNSDTVTISVSSPLTATYRFSFTASADHATTVTSYRLNVYAMSADPQTATALAVSDLGKPTPDAQNVISVDRTSFVLSLPAGNYLATVGAVGTGGVTQSNAVVLTR